MFRQDWGQPYYSTDRNTNFHRQKALVHESNTTRNAFPDNKFNEPDMIRAYLFQASYSKLHSQSRPPVPELHHSWISVAHECVAVEVDNRYNWRLPQVETTIPSTVISQFEV
jgi:hypothetical protein